MGDWNGCFNYSALITFTAVVNMPTPPTPTTPTPTPTTTPVTPAKAVTTPAKAVPNTGPGDVIGLFAGASAAGTAAHAVVTRRRR